MTILGLGVDIVHLPRVAALVARRGSDRFARRILSANEMIDWNGRPNDPLKFLAVRFSVKEAAYKALYPRFRPTWKELTYKSFGYQSKGSKPSLQYAPPALGPRTEQIHVSVSHDGECVMSTVIMEGI